MTNAFDGRAAGWSRTQNRQNRQMGPTARARTLTKEDMSENVTARGRRGVKCGSITCNEWDRPGTHHGLQTLPSLVLIRQIDKRDG